MEESFGAMRYGQVLQAIGARLDAEGRQDVTICEVMDGYIARAARGDTGPHDGLAFSFAEVTTMVAALGATPPGDGDTTYQTLLASLGQELDKIHAQMITIIELSLGLLVLCYPLGYHTEGCYGERYEFLYQPEAIDGLTARAALSAPAHVGGEAVADTPRDNPAADMPGGGSQ